MLVNRSLAVTAGGSKGNVSCTGYGSDRIASTALASLQVDRYCVPERRLAGSVGGQVERRVQQVRGVSRQVSISQLALSFLHMCYAKLIIIGRKKKARGSGWQEQDNASWRADDRQELLLRSLIYYWEAYWADSATTGPAGYLRWGREATIVTTDGYRQGNDFCSVECAAVEWTTDALALRGVKCQYM